MSFKCLFFRRGVKWRIAQGSSEPIGGISRRNSADCAREGKKERYAKFLSAPSLLRGFRNAVSGCPRGCQIQSHRRARPMPEFNVIFLESPGAFVIGRFEIKHVFDIEDVADIESPNSHESGRPSSEQEGINSLPLPLPSCRCDRRKIRFLRAAERSALCLLERKLVARSRIIPDYRNSANRTINIAILISDI